MKLPKTDRQNMWQFFEGHVVIAAFETPLLSERICRELVVAADLAREDGRRKSALPFAAKEETTLPK